MSAVVSRLPGELFTLFPAVSAAQAAPATEQATVQVGGMTDVTSRHRYHWRHHYWRHRHVWHRPYYRHYGWYRGHHYGWYRHRRFHDWDYD